MPPHLRFDETGLDTPRGHAAERHEGLSILVVDDNRHHLDILQTVLGAAGHACAPCQSGADAIGALGQHRYDLVMLDMVMPDVNGMAVLRAMRQGGPNTQTPVFACTANHILARRDLDGCFGILDIIAKPIDLRALVGAVSRVQAARRGAH